MAYEHEVVVSRQSEMKFLSIKNMQFDARGPMNRSLLGVKL